VESQEGVEIVHKELSYAVVGCAQRVHTALGPGFPEAVYQRALSHELAKAGIPFQAQARFEVAYDGCPCGEFRVDMYVDEKIVLELKAADGLCKQHEAQSLAYLKATGARLAILINFGEQSLNFRRFVR
jgi:GxxExxY protein